MYRIIPCIREHLPSGWVRPREQMLRERTDRIYHILLSVILSKGIWQILLETAWEFVWLNIVSK